MLKNEEHRKWWEKHQGRDIEGKKGVDTLIRFGICVEMFLFIER